MNTVEGSPSDRVVRITVDAGAPPDEMEALRLIFERAGADVEVDDGYVRLSAGDLPWAMIVAAPVLYIAGLFAGGFFQKAGEDTWDAFRDGGWRGMREFLRAMYQARSGSDGNVKVDDPTGPQVDLDPALPDEALRELADLDWSAMRGGRLGWSPDRGWVYLAGSPLESAPRRDRD